MARQIGNSRNDTRQPRLPKDPAKREREMAIREFAKNNGISIRVAKVMFEEAEEENTKPQFKKNIEGICPVCGAEGNLEFGSAEIDEGGVKYPWDCEDCGASGEEWYDMTFSEHCNVTDKDGKEYANKT